MTPKPEPTPAPAPRPAPAVVPQPRTIAASSAPSANGNTPAVPVTTVSAGSPSMPAITRSASYRTENLRVGRGDTWEAISNKAYYTPKYAQALRAFNHENGPGEYGLYDADKRLVAGMPVQIPEASLLEERYATFVSNK